MNGVLCKKVSNSLIFSDPVRMIKVSLSYSDPVKKTFVISEKLLFHIVTRSLRQDQAPTLKSPFNLLTGSLMKAAFCYGSLDKAFYKLTGSVTTRSVYDRVSL